MCKALVVCASSRPTAALPPPPRPVCCRVVMRDLLLGTPPQCNGLLCEFLGIAPGGWVNSATVLLGVAGLLVAPFAGFR